MESIPDNAIDGIVAFLMKFWMNFHRPIFQSSVCQYPKTSERRVQILQEFVSPNSNGKYTKCNRGKG